MKLTKKISFGIGILFVLLAIFTAYGWKGEVMALGRAYDHLKIFAEVLTIVEDNYVELIETDKLIEGAINGMLRTLDPHSAYMNLDRYKEMKIETQGEFGGLGIEITIRDGILTIVSPIEDTPAFKAGIKAGDRILKIENEATRDITLMEAVKKLRGKPGTSVNITVVRKGESAPFEVTITRAIIEVKSVRYEVIEDDIGYIKIRKFLKKTGNELEEAIKKLKKEDIYGLILDLRNNPGGLLDQAVKVAGKFLDSGELVVYTKGRADNQDKNYKTHRRGIYTEGPMIVLVNAGSASASEIVAGALQDLKRALILGTPSFGKGSVQTVIPLSDNSGLRLTTALYYTPNDRVIQGKGIKPDIVMESPPPLQLTDKSKKNRGAHLHEKDLKNHLEVIEEAKKEDTEETKSQESKSHNKAKTVMTPTDFVKDRAVELLKSWAVFERIKG